MKTQWKLVLLATVAITTAVVSLIIFHNDSSLSLSPECQSVVASGFHLQTETGFTYTCGNITVSDGRLQITVHDYRIAQAKNISFTPSPNEPPPAPSDVFAIANVTVSNIGSGNSSIGGGFSAQVGGSGFPPVQNANLSINATFSGTYPNETLPNINGGVYLPPGKRLDFWLLFYVPNASANNVPSLSLQYFAYREIGYGGNYLGGGGFDCTSGTCQHPLVEFVIAEIPSG